MLTLEQLRHLAALGSCGTLTKAAEELHISQPTLTRTMKELERQFGVPLFTRTKNRIQLNENGELALTRARELLNRTEDMVAQVQALDRSRHTLSLGSCAPIPLNDLVQRCTSLYPDRTLASEIRSVPPLLDGLRQGRYQFIVLPFHPADNDVISQPFGKEELFFYLPENHPLAHRSSLSFQEMDGENMIVFSKIGFWYDLIVEQMPHSRFLLQQDRNDFRELVAASVLPCFLTERSAAEFSVAGRVAIPIRNEEARVQYELAALPAAARQYPRLMA